jgi:hypothetical protein
MVCNNGIHILIFINKYNYWNCIQQLHLIYQNQKLISDISKAWIHKKGKETKHTYLG